MSEDNDQDDVEFGSGSSRSRNISRIILVMLDFSGSGDDEVAELNVGLKND